MTTQPFADIVDLGAFLRQDLDKLTKQEVRQLHIDTARRLKADVIADSGMEPRVTTLVDGRRDASEDQVKPFGIIAYRFQYWSVFLRAGVEFARSISPVLSGLYRDSWFVLADGLPVANIDNPPEADEYIITNDQPYARIVEVGKRGKKKKFRAGNHVAQKTTKMMNQRFGNSISVSTRFISLSGTGSGRADTVPWITRKGSAVTYPAVVIRAV